MCSLQGLVLFVKSAHDGLPSTASFFKLFALSRQLFPDILPLKNVLERQKKEKIVVMDMCSETERQM